MALQRADEGVAGGPLPSPHSVTLCGLNVEETWRYGPEGPEGWFRLYFYPGFAGRWVRWAPRRAVVRAAYKLLELDDKFHFLVPGARVVDLGSAPGGWAQVAVPRVNALGERSGKPQGRVLGLDLQEVDPMPGAEIHQLDFLVLSVNGVAPNPALNNLQDTVSIPFQPPNGAPGEVIVAVPFLRPEMIGKFVYHCHILFHEDRGMMQTIVVTKDGPLPPESNCTPM